MRAPVLGRPSPPRRTDSQQWVGSASGNAMDDFSLVRLWRPASQECLTSHLPRLPQLPAGRA
jgi:hypothetical protein